MEPCDLCKSTARNDALYGEFLVAHDVKVHTFCMYLSSNLSQNASFGNGLFGFTPEDIKREVRRATLLKCCYCGRNRASIGCCEKRCMRSFHLICGIENGALNQFSNCYVSYCHKHLPKYGDAKPGKNDKCIICLDKIYNEGNKTYDVVKMLQAPCCRNGWFHKLCLQNMAKSAGYFFRCPLCNDTSKFRKTLQLRGIFIPDCDAVWETEPNAYEELSSRPETCAATNCSYSRGRQLNDMRMPSLYCDVCGSFAVHACCCSEPSYRCNVCVRVIPIDEIIERSFDGSDIDENTNTNTNDSFNSSNASSEIASDEVSQISNLDDIGNGNINVNVNVNVNVNANNNNKEDENGCNNKFGYDTDDDSDFDYDIDNDNDNDNLGDIVDDVDIESDDVIDFDTNSDDSFEPSVAKSTAKESTKANIQNNNDNDNKDDDYYESDNFMVDDYDVEHSVDEYSFEDDEDDDDNDDNDDDSEGDDDDNDDENNFHDCDLDYNFDEDEDEVDCDFNKIDKKSVSDDSDDEIEVKRKHCCTLIIDNSSSSSEDFKSCEENENVKKLNKNRRFKKSETEPTCSNRMHNNNNNNYLNDSSCIARRTRRSTYVFNNNNNNNTTNNNDVNNFSTTTSFLSSLDVDTEHCIANRTRQRIGSQAQNESSNSEKSSIFTRLKQLRLKKQQQQQQQEKHKQQEQQDQQQQQQLSRLLRRRIKENAETDDLVTPSQSKRPRIIKVQNNSREDAMPTVEADGVAFVTQRTISRSAMRMQQQERVRVRERQHQHQRQRQRNAENSNESARKKTLRSGQR